MSKYNYKGIIETQKKEKIIEEYMCFSSNELVEILIDRDLEIERLNNRVKQLEKSIMISNKKHSFLTKDNIKLNNIINELEKMMKNDLECACSMNENGLFNGAIDILEVYLDKLHELKGDGSNE